MKQSLGNRIQRRIDLEKGRLDAYLEFLYKLPLDITIKGKVSMRLKNCRERCRMLRSYYLFVTTGIDNSSPIE